MKVEGEKVILTFGNVGDGLTTSDRNRYGYVNGFSIAGADRKFVWAKAYIDGNKVVVFSEKVPNPVAVRYGWSNNPYDDNLVNSAGLLASPSVQTSGKELPKMSRFFWFDRKDQ